MLYCYHHDLNYSSVPSPSRASWSALSLGGCQQRAGAGNPKFGQSFASWSHPAESAHKPVWAGGSRAGADPLVRVSVTWPSLPSLALDTPWFASRAGPGGGGKGRHWAFCVLHPTQPSPETVLTSAPGWAEGAQGSPGRGKNSGWSRDCGQYPGSTPSGQASSTGPSQI
jgi:hypothetical protein